MFKTFFNFEVLYWLRGPTSLDLIDALREQTPVEHQYLLKDLFEQITLFENRTKSATVKTLENGKFEVTLKTVCEKFKTVDQGKQEKLAIDDWIEIGAFAAPQEGMQYGKTLYRERVKIDKEECEFKFTVDEAPALAGVDPFSLMIDRTPEDNLKKPVQE